MNYIYYIKNSLELHLFFDRIMMEHSIFLEASFMEKDKKLKKIANSFHRLFSNILDRVVSIANQNISKEFISSDEIVTKNTIEAEVKTSKLTGIVIDTNITEKELHLKSGNINISKQLIEAISDINRQTIPAIENLINFKQEVLKQVSSCNLYTTNYPLLINHIVTEAKMYYELLTKVERREIFTSNYIYEQELFWNNIMKEHAEFIRGLLDPSEKQLIQTASKFVNEYETNLNNYRNNINYLNTISLKETTNFKDFKIAAEDGILNCKIKSIIIPLLTDHVLREANHFIRILKGLV